MKVATRITFLDDSGEKFFGEGPARLLHGIEESGSLRAAAMSMGMAYTKALRIMKHAEAALGFALTTRTAGGRDGGGSRLTAEGRAWLEKYEACRDACAASDQALVRRFFPAVGCVIMASGMSRRFGSNKLLADLGGGPMILRALEATEGVVQRRVVVTRHEEVAALCRARGAAVVLHDLPHRNDTVRLGLEALGELDGCMFLPGDQPLLRRETTAALVRAWEADQERILRPACGDTPGAPVLFPRWAFPELLALPEGKGGSYVLRRHPDRVAVLPVADPYELMDADTPEALQLLRQVSLSREGGSHDQKD